MLIAQAVFASEIFTQKHLGAQVIERIYSEILREKENLYLIGMPGSGKSTLAMHLAREMNRPLTDSDSEIVKETGETIPSIFEARGEAEFRRIEASVMHRISSECQGFIVATGGGCILRAENVAGMRRSGRIYFIDRDVDRIAPSSDRPLSMDRDALKRRFEERYEKYLGACDVHVDANGEIADTVKKIREDFLK